jgi:hypothetical protein
MGEHIDTRAPKRKKVKEHDEAARRRRASFKQYLRQVEEELLEEDLDDDFDDFDDLDN